MHTSDPQRDGEEDPSAFCWNELGGSVRHMFRPAPGASKPTQFPHLWKGGSAITMHRFTACGHGASQNPTHELACIQHVVLHLDLHPGSLTHIPTGTPTPGANCMLGPLDARPKERAAPAPRAARKRKEPTGPAVRPEELQELGQGQGQEKKETDRNLELMHGVIKELEDQLVRRYT